MQSSLLKVNGRMMITPVKSQVVLISKVNLIDFLGPQMFSHIG